jgi:uncharacterized membrane protein YbhN (UPF0104 family)
MSEPEKNDAAAGARRLKRWLRPLMLVVTAVFVVLSAVDLSRRWESRSIHVSAGWLALSLVPVLVGAVLQGAAWILLVERMSRKQTPRWRALCLYFESQLARYTPGKVGLPLVRMEGAPSLGLSRRVIALSVLIEMLSWTATGAVSGFFLLRVAGAPTEGLGGVAGKLATPLLAASLLLALALIAVDRRHAPLRVRSALGLEGEGPLAPARLPFLQLFYWATWAIHGYFLARALGAENTGALSTMGFSPLANVLGFVALAAPAGVGVREAVLLAGLSPVLGGPGAVGAAVLSRVVSLIADLATWLVARRLNARAPQAS